MNLLNILLTVSEKAANIARVCRQNENLFNLLVQEKENDEANNRFFKDFKTLADVLIQETVRHDIKQHYPVLEDFIFGEENNKFTNTLGETIEVKVCSCQEETTQLLEIILNGNSTAANILASEVHKTIILSDVNVDSSSVLINFDEDIDNMSIWIDPIDSTAEYIHAKETLHESGIHLTGLQCVTVLIGAYNKTTGVPLIGIVNQPFYEQLNSKWKGKCYWGVNTSKETLSSIQIPNNKSTNIITSSKIEYDVIKSKLKENGYSIVEAAGAGYKLLTVISGLADAYLVSQGTTFRWDVCGPHAILRAMGGGVYSYIKMTEKKIIEINYKNDASYDSKMNKYCNKEGLIAVRSKEVFDNIMQILQN